MATVDLFNLIFQQILKIDYSILYNYSTLEDQILYLILIPHVLLFLFLFAFSRGIVARFISGHRGLQYLTGLVAYIYIIYAGWYGSFLVPLLLGWFTIALGLGLFLFLISIIWHPAAMRGGARLVTAASADISKRAGKGKEKKRLDEEIKLINKQIRDYRREKTPQSAAYIETTIGHLKAEKTRLEHERDNL